MAEVGYELAEVECDVAGGAVVGAEVEAAVVGEVGVGVFVLVADVFGGAWGDGEPDGRGVGAVGVEDGFTGGWAGDGDVPVDAFGGAGWELFGA